MREQATSLYNSVRDTVKPTVVTYTDKIRTEVAPTLKNVLKSSLNAVFTGVPRVIKQVNMSDLSDLSDLYRRLLSKLPLSAFSRGP